MFFRGLIGLIAVLVPKKGHEGKIFGYSKSFSSTSHPSPSGFDQQFLFEQIPKTEHSVESSETQVNDQVDKQLHPM